MFYVRQNDEFCLNCGCVEMDSNVWKEYARFFRNMLIVSVLFFIVGFLFATGSFVNLLSLFFISSGAGVICGLGIEHLYYVRMESKTGEIFVTRTLKFKENTIKKRLTELSKRENNIEIVLNKIGENPSRNLQSVQQKLLSAQEIIGNQFARYQLQKSKIELVRFQNSISPYLEDIHSLNDIQTENGIVSAEQTNDKINLLRQTLDRDFPVTSENEDFLHQLRETSKSCEELREVLLSKQALRALQGVQPTEDIQLNSSTKEISHATETFNIQTTLTDFSQSFEELEREYERLKAENEIGQESLLTE